MTDAEANGTTKPNWTIIAVLALFVSLLFFGPFISIICLSGLMAYLWYPVYRKVNSRLPESVSVTIILIISSLVIILPVAFILFLLFQQALELVQALSNLKAAPGTPLYEISHNIATLTGNEAVVNDNSIIKLVNNTLPETIKIASNTLFGFVNNITKMLANIVLYVFMFMAFLKYNKQIRVFVESISPFNRVETKKYGESSGAIVTASLRGQFIISFITAVSSAVLLSFVFNLWDYFVLMLFIFTILGMVPLGSGIVIIPYTILQMTVNFAPAFWVLIIYLLVICSIDSLLRPFLIPKKANLVPAVTTLATYCGLYYFGMLGIVYGPLIVILLMTTANIYISSHPRNKLSEPRIT